MNWRYKAFLHFVFSNIPFGLQLNYFIQRFVTRSLPCNNRHFIRVVTLAIQHLDMIKQYMLRPLNDATFYEFGAGWDMIGPLTLYSLGIENQVIIDVQKLLKPWLVNNSVSRIQHLSRELDLLRYPQNKIDENNNFFHMLKKDYGITYKAPCDARYTGLEGGSIDCITSSSTLEHIPFIDIQEILRECYRILRNDGLMSFVIDYQDHYHDFDKNISVYNFMQYSDKEWSVFSPSSHYQNRLRHKDYLDLFHKHGFEVVKQRITEGSTSDREVIKQLSIDERFRPYSLTELAIRDSMILLRKRNKN